MKSWIIIGALLLTAVLPAFAQSDIYSTKEGSITFFSSAPLEDIEAKNSKAISLLNTRNNEIAVRVPIKQFQFRNKLMQEHFNENYMESEKYPHATFKGKINETIDFQKSGTYQVTSTGILNIHGVNQQRTLKGKLIINGSGMTLDTQFDVLLVDHKIRIPKIVFNKIAEKIAVTTRFDYSQQAK
jgi:hypothetical protein